MPIWKCKDRNTHFLCSCDLNSSITFFIYQLISYFPLCSHDFCLLYMLSSKDKAVTLSIAYYLIAALKVHLKV